VNGVQLLSEPLVSRRTMALAVGGLVGVLVVRALMGLQVGGEPTSRLLAEAGPLAVLVVAAAVTLRTALGFERGESLRRQWSLIGLGLLALVGGELASFFAGAALGASAAPGLPDALRVTGYVLLCTGLLLAAFSYRDLIDARVPLAVSAVVSYGIGIVVYFSLLEPYVIAGGGLTGTARALAVFYPLADVLGALAPALFLTIVVSRLYGGRLSWPWIAFALGVLALGVSDTAHSVLSSADLYRPGHPLETGWLLAPILMAIGASIASDVVELPLGE